MFVKPSRAGLKVIDPVHMRAIPAEGQEVDEKSVYWHRLIVCGDVVEVKKVSEEAEKSASKKEKKPAEGAK